MTTKITKLTALNIRALAETLPSYLVTLGKTTATFNTDATEALRVVYRAQVYAGARYGHSGHPYRSLSAVIRKLSQQGN